MPGVLNLTEPCHLLTKLEHELQALTVDRSNSYAAINGLRDAYHLREWIWHDRLERDPALQAAILGTNAKEEDWDSWVNKQFSDFRIVRELCNGSKHFEPGNVVQGTHRGGLDSKVPFFDNPHSGFDDNGFHVEVDAGRIVSVVDLLTRARDFWAELFTRFPQLGSP
jgi:hypothetical protein